MVFTNKSYYLGHHHFVASELKDPICHSNECQIGSFSSEATIWYTLCLNGKSGYLINNVINRQLHIHPFNSPWCFNLFTTIHDGNFRRHSSMNVTIKWHKFSSNIYYIYVFFVICSWKLRKQFQLQMTKNRTPTPVYLDPDLEVKGLKHYLAFMETSVILCSWSINIHESLSIIYGNIILFVTHFKSSSSTTIWKSRQFTIFCVWRVQCKFGLESVNSHSAGIDFRLRFWSYELVDPRTVRLKILILAVDL